MGMPWKSAAWRNLSGGSIAVFSAAGDAGATDRNQQKSRHGGLICFRHALKAPYALRASFAPIVTVCQPLQAPLSELLA
jgi:hypothetical protein